MSTIQQLIAATPAFGTLVIPPGVYIGEKNMLVVNGRQERLTIRASGCTFDGEHHYQPGVFLQSKNLRIHGKPTFLHGLTSVVGIKGCDDCRINGAIVEDAQPTSDKATFGIAITGSTSTRIVKCQVSGWFSKGILALGEKGGAICSNTLIDRCIVTWQGSLAKGNKFGISSYNAINTTVLNCGVIWDASLMMGEAPHQPCGLIGTDWMSGGTPSGLQITGCVGIMLPNSEAVLPSDSTYIGMPHGIWVTQHSDVDVIGLTVAMLKPGFGMGTLSIDADGQSSHYFAKDCTFIGHGDTLKVSPEWTIENFRRLEPNAEACAHLISLVSWTKDGVKLKLAKK